MRTALLMLPLLPQLLVLSNAHAQERGPWTTALSMTRKALAVGECSAVSLDLKGAKGESPRGPNGQLVSMADFDFNVTAPTARAAVGQYDGARSFAVCACPKAPVGTVATVTATYPSKWIAPKVRAPGVSFTTSFSTPIVAGTSSGNPPGCDPSGSTTSGAWMVTVQPSVSMLPIGGCTAVSLTIRDSTGKDTPRGPSGQRVSLADFDMSATSANGVDVVGKYDGASAFSACACQSGTVGEAATITAKYPAQQLDAKLRVAGVAMQATAPITLAAARGAANPAGCEGRQLALVRGPARVAPVAPVASGAAGAAAGGAAGGAANGAAGGAAGGAPGAGAASAPNAGTVAGGAGAAAGGASSGGAGGAAAGAPGSATDPASGGAAGGSAGASAGGAAGGAAGAAAGGAGGAAAGKSDSTSGGGGKSAKRRDPAASPAAPAPTIRDAPPTLKDPVAVAPGTGRAPLITHSGASPTNVAVSASPRIARLSWTATPNASRYAVYRGTGSAVSIERTPPAFTATQFADTVPDAHETYRYAVIAYYADGTQGEAPAVQFTSPPMVNPAGFTAQSTGVVGGGGITFQWQAVPGAARYRIDGPGLPATGYFAIGTSAAHPHMLAGPNTWRLQTMYPGNIGDSASASIASTVVHVLPAHATPWLTHRNGAGTLSQVQAPRQQEYNDVTGGYFIGNWSGDLLNAYSPDSVTWLGQDLTFLDQWQGFFIRDIHKPCLSVYEALTTSECSVVGLKVWLNLFTDSLWDDPGQGPKEAVYGNPSDLGVGRRAFCVQQLRSAAPQRGQSTPTVPGLYTVCYATAHGALPGQAGFNDPQTITHPEEGVGSDFILSMVITKDPTGTVFLVLGKNGKYSLLNSVRLDTEGPKLVPFVCISCHGGTYNPTTRKVDGSSYLPLDPTLLSFASPADKAAQEEKIRKINRIIYDAQPGTAIAHYLSGLYNGAIGTAGATAVPDYVPASWAPQAGFYRQVVRPNCTMCHLAAPDNWNFASWQNFQDNASLIYADVCQQHTMPHAEVPFKNFWLKDTGILYLPGLLAATLGKPSC